MLTEKYSEILTESLHHAYGMVGDVSAVAVELKKMIAENMGIAVIGNPARLYSVIKYLVFD